MESLTFINCILKYTFLSLMTFYIFAKTINYTCISNKMKFISFFTSIFIGFIYTFLIKYIPNIIALLISILIISFSITFFYKFKLGSSIAITSISMTIAFSCYIISLFIASAIIELFFINLDNQNSLLFFIYACLCFFIIFKLFKIKRFSHGFSFLKDDEKLNNFSIIGLILSGNLAMLSSILKQNRNDITWSIGIIGLFFIILGCYIWIRRNITLDYQDHMKNRKIELLESDLQSAQEKNKELTNEIQNLTMINHKYSSRIKAAEQEIKKLAYIYSSINNTEISTELSDITKLVQNLLKEYTNELSSNLAYCPTLPKTNVLGVDILFEHLQTEAIKNNIKLELKINCSIKHLIEKFIPQNKLETLIGDHVKDAIIAINSGNKTSKNICVVFDIVDNFYRISFYDNGIDFKISTLVNLGLEAVTTHKDTGGSGMGFLTTFKTLSECKASLIIEEIFFEHSNFNKCITISFDGKSEYLIHSKRFSEIKQSDIHHRIKEHS